MRVDVIYDDQFPGQAELWQANCRRSRRGKKGQAVLREIEAALVAMPDKLIHKDVFVEANGETCAIGALAIQRRVQSGESRKEAAESLSMLCPYDTEEHGVDLGFPRMVAWSIAVENDDDRRTTPEERYNRMLAWVRGELLSE